jgi:hypothetical protein
MKLLERFNEYCNNEFSSMPHGMPVSYEHLEAIAIRASIYAFARKYNLKESIPVEELENLADLIEAQGNESIQRHQTVMKAAQERHGGDLDAL